MAAAQAQITKTERRITEYVDYMTRNDLFFDPATDERLRCTKEKLAQKRANYADLYALLQKEVEKHRANPGIYKLFVGFDKLGEFGSAQEARSHAENCGRSGTFNIIGDRYRDSWYQSEKA